MCCPNGNTCEIDGYKFIQGNLENTEIINFIKW